MSWRTVAACCGGALALFGGGITSGASAQQNLIVTVGAEQEPVPVGTESIVTFVVTGGFGVESCEVVIPAKLLNNNRPKDLFEAHSTSIHCPHKATGVSLSGIFSQVKMTSTGVVAFHGKQGAFVVEERCRYKLTLNKLAGTFKTFGPSDLFKGAAEGKGEKKNPVDCPATSEIEIEGVVGRLFEGLPESFEEYGSVVDA